MGAMVWVARVRGACMSWGHMQRARAGTNAHPRGTHTETGARKGEELEGSGKGKGVGNLRRSVPMHVLAGWVRREGPAQAYYFGVY